jgi:hypothetical protein
MAKKPIEKRDELRIMKPTPKVFSTVKKLAKKEQRSMARQADYMLLQYIEQNNL